MAIQVFCSPSLRHRLGSSAAASCHKFLQIAYVRHIGCSYYPPSCRGDTWVNLGYVGHPKTSTRDMIERTSVLLLQSTSRCCDLCALVRMRTNMVFEAPWNHLETCVRRGVLRGKGEKGCMKVSVDIPNRFIQQIWHNRGCRLSSTFFELIGLQVLFDHMHILVQLLIHIFSVLSGCQLSWRKNKY